MTEDMPHILVVDDDTRLRELLRKYLAGNGFLVATAQDAADARAKLGGLAFDLIVLDIMMPGESGLELTESLRRDDDNIPILLLTARGEPDDRIAGLEAGADDYLAKPFQPRELLLRINSILRRQAAKPPDPVPAQPVRLGPLLYLPDRDELRNGEEVIRLTTAEASLLRVLAGQPGVTFTREELTERSKVAGNARTIDVQVTRLRRKIEPDPREPRYLHTVRGEGYVLRPDG
ncbi:response regulator [Azospirillum sp.]|uniref:response regulator n=1 Tax=Azospirillum sp. TaxID=34012 RepID=UPI002D60198B|nr:response regulator [Azospirillum sp.]HYD71440.1 response regulator [Azospirillum sp.]